MHCAQKQLFPDDTQKAVFTDQKRHLRTKLSLHYTAGTALCIPFNLCYVLMLVLGMVAEVMQVIDNIKCGIYTFYVSQNLTVGFQRQSDQYDHYFI